MYLYSDSRRAPANDVKLAPMTGRTPTCAVRLSVWLCLLLSLGGPLAASAAASSLIGQSAPDFALPALVGSNIRLSEFRGQPVIVTFWSSHCSTCAKQLVALDHLYGTYRSSGLVVLAVSVDDDAQRAQAYAHAHTPSYPLLLDNAKSVSRSFAIDRLPSTVMIDRSGVVRYLHRDDRSDDTSYVAQIRALLDDNVGTP
jgi:peroxiredoxin